MKKKTIILLVAVASALGITFYSLVHIFLLEEKPSIEEQGVTFENEAVNAEYVILDREDKDEVSEVEDPGIPKEMVSFYGRLVQVEKEVFVVRVLEDRSLRLTSRTVYIQPGVCEKQLQISNNYRFATTQIGTDEYICSRVGGLIID